MNEISSTSLMNTSLKNDHIFTKKNFNYDLNSKNESNKSKEIRSTKAIKSPNDLMNKIPFYPASTHIKSLKKSIAENNTSTHDHDKEKTTIYSTWTPLNDEKYNQKLFEERKQLFTKWFETWNESQRRIVIEDILNLCKPKQLFFARDTLNKISPIYHLDFTRILPRVICLYIMSFLDPRSLCRCSQVSWYWKMLSESDQLWIPKCLRFGWNLNYIPSSFETGIWKQFYTENIKALQYVPVKKLSITPVTTERNEINLNEISNGKFGFSNLIISSNPTNTKFSKTESLKQPPWKANNSNPNHFYRFNYLDQELSNDKKKCFTKQSNLAGKKNSIKRNNDDAFIQNESKIETLISKGQTLINQLDIMTKNDEMYSKVVPKNNFDLFTTSDMKQEKIESINSVSNDKGTTSNSVKPSWNYLEK